MTSSPHILRGFLWGSREPESHRSTGVFLALVFDIALDGGFVEPNGGDKVPDAPDAAVEVHLPDEFEALFDSDARFDLEGLHDGSHRQVGWDLDLKVDMIIVHVGRVDVERRGLFDDGVTGGKKFTLYIVFEIFASVARTPDEVVLSLVDRVVETAGSHGTSLAREYPC